MTTLLFRLKCTLFMLDVIVIVLWLLGWLLAIVLYLYAIRKL